jgi:hypothetical protein
MSEHSAELLSAVNEICELLRLMAEAAIAARDGKLRDELREIVGTSKAKANCVLLMDGTRTQAAIRTETGYNQGNLSTLVKKLTAVELLSGDGRQPKLAISIPPNFFDDDAQTE